MRSLGGWLGVAGLLVVGLACSSGTNSSDSDSGTMSTTVAMSTGTTEVSSGSDSETGTSDGGSASEGQTNTTDLSGSNSDSQGGTSTSDGPTGDDSLSGGGSSSTTSGTSTGDVVPCGDYQELKTCEEDPSCQGVVAHEFVDEISAWCIGEPVFLGCIDGDLKCGGDAQTVCVGDAKYLLQGICLPEGVSACDPPAGGPNWKPC